MGHSARIPGAEDVAGEVALLHSAAPWFDERIHARGVRGEAAPVVHHEVVGPPGSPVGVVLALLPAPMNGAARTAVVVHPEHRGQGLGSLLWRSAQPSLSGRVVMGSIRDDDPASLAVAIGWGLEPVQHSVGSRLDLAPGLVAPQPPAGSVLRRIDSWFPPERVAAAWMASDTSPEADLFGATGPDVYAGLFDSPVMLWLERGDDVLAVLGCHRATDDLWSIVYTGTPAQHRGHGYARALKVQLHAVAAADGVVRLETANEEENAAIRALNATLGYQPSVGEIRVRRDAG